MILIYNYSRGFINKTLYRNFNSNMNKFGYYLRKYFGLLRGVRESYPLKAIIDASKCDVMPPDIIRRIDQTIKDETIIQVDVTLEKEDDVFEVRDSLEDEYLDKKATDVSIDKASCSVSNNDIPTNVDGCDEKTSKGRMQSDIEVSQINNSTSSNNVKEAITIFEDININESMDINVNNINNTIHTNDQVSDVGNEDFTVDVNRESNIGRAFSRNATFDESKVPIDDSCKIRNDECTSLQNSMNEKDILKHTEAVETTSCKLQDSMNWIPAEMDSSLNPTDARRLSLSKCNMSKLTSKKQSTSKIETNSGKVKTNKKVKSTSDKKNKKRPIKKYIKSTKSKQNKS